MKKFTLILLALCITATLFSAVACTKDQYDDFEETPDLTDGPLDLEKPDGAVTAPPSENENGNSYINSAPANEEQGWGPIIPRP